MGQIRSSPILQAPETVSGVPIEVEYRGKEKGRGRILQATWPEFGADCD